MAEVLCLNCFTSELELELSFVTQDMVFLLTCKNKNGKLTNQENLNTEGRHISGHGAVCEIRVVQYDIPGLRISGTASVPLNQSLVLAEPDNPLRTRGFIFAGAI